MYSNEKERLKQELVSRRIANGVILDALKRDDLTLEQRQELIANYDNLLDEHYKEELAICEQIDDTAEERGFWKGYWFTVGCGMLGTILGALTPKVIDFFKKK